MCRRIPAISWAKFTHVTYNYYEQLNGYRYLKSLGIGYHFYQGKYTTAIAQILDTDKKTILHIPNVNSGESTKQKHDEVDFILDSIGTVEWQDSTTGIITVKRHRDGNPSFAVRGLNRLFSRV